MSVSSVQSCLVCLGAFLIQMVVFGVYNNFGLVYYHLLKEFGGSSEETAFVGSLATGLSFLVSPVSNIILLRCGCAVHIILSTLLCVLALATSSCVNSLHMLILTYSILWGFGAGLANHASLVSIQEHFTKRLSLANGIVTSGTGVGTLLLGPLLEHLLQVHKFRWAFRVFALVPLFFLVTLISLVLKKYKYKLDEPSTPAVKTTSISSEASKISHGVDTSSFEMQPTDSEKEDLMKKPDIHANGSMNHVTNDTSTPNNDRTENPQKTEKCRSISRTIFDKELWRNKSLVFYTIGLSTFLFGYFIPFTFMVEYATRQGIDIAKAQFLVGLLAIASTVAKILFGAIMDSQTFIKRSTFMIIILYLMSLSHIIVPFAKHYWHFCCFSLIFGTLEGCFVGQICSVIVDLVDNKDKVGAAIGNLFAFMSIAVVTGPVVAGSLISVLDSYATPFYVASGVSLIGSIIATFLKFYENSTDTSNECNGDSEARGIIMIEE